MQKIKERKPRYARPQHFCYSQIHITHFECAYRLFKGSKFDRVTPNVCFNSRGIHQVWANFNNLYFRVPIMTCNDSVPAVWIVCFY